MKSTPPPLHSSAMRCACPNVPASQNDLCRNCRMAAPPSRKASAASTGSAPSRSSEAVSSMGYSGGRLSVSQSGHQTVAMPASTHHRRQKETAAKGDAQQRHRIFLKLLPPVRRRLHPLFQFLQVGTEVLPRLLD